MCFPGGAPEGAAQPSRHCALQEILRLAYAPRDPAENHNPHARLVRMQVMLIHSYEDKVTGTPDVPNTTLQDGVRAAEAEGEGWSHGLPCPEVRALSAPAPAWLSAAQPRSEESRGAMSST